MHFTRATLVGSNRSRARDCLSRSPFCLTPLARFNGPQRRCQFDSAGVWQLVEVVVVFADGERAPLWQVEPMGCMVCDYGQPHAAVR